MDKTKGQIKDILIKASEKISEIIERIESDDRIKKTASGQSTVQPLYIDSSGKVFSAKSIVQGYRPSKKYKGYSLSNLINKPGYGSVKNYGKSKKKKTKRKK